LIRVVEIDDAMLSIDDADDVHAGLQILTRLDRDVFPRVVRRDYLEHDFRRRARITKWALPLRHPLVAVKANVGATNGVRIALSDDARVVGKSAAKLAIADKVAR
jgi:hypothetical protein